MTYHPRRCVTASLLWKVPELTTCLGWDVAAIATVPHTLFHDTVAGELHWNY